VTVYNITEKDIKKERKEGDAGGREKERERERGERERERK